VKEDWYRFTELETFVSVVDAISERGIGEMMAEALRSQRFNAGSEILETTRVSQEFCHTYRSNAKSSNYGT